MDEQINKPVDTTTAAPENTTPLAQQPVTATQAPQSSIPLTSSVTARPAENLPAGVSDYSAEIAQLYDAQMAAQAQALETAYNQNLEAANYAKSQIAPQFTAQGNDLATQYERTRRNNNMQADMNGLNTGTGSQMALAQQSNYLDAFGKVRAAQAQAETEADRQIANLEISYKSAVAQALAQNDYQKAAALMQEYQRRDNAAEEMRRYNQAQAEQDAKVRAAYGDFGGYAALYGQDVANSMQKYWAMNNPDYAYSMGLISAAEYQAMTGMAPGGYSSGGSSGGYYRRSGGSGSYGGSSSSGGAGDDSAYYSGIGQYTDGGTGGVDAATQSWADFLNMREVYGSDSAAYAQQMKNAEMNAQGQAEMVAVQAGLKPGSAAYREFVAQQKADILATDANYIAARNGANAVGESRKAAALAEKNKQTASYGPNSSVVYGWNAELSPEQANAAAKSASTYTSKPVTVTKPSGATSTVNVSSGTKATAPKAAGNNNGTKPYAGGSSGSAKKTTATKKTTMTK